MIARYLLPIVLLASAAPAWAQDTAAKPFTLQGALGDPDNLRVSGSIRARYEALDGQFRPGLDEDDDLVSFRTTIFAEYDTGPIRIGGEVMDSRGYADDLGSGVSANDVNALELIQGYVGLDLNDALGRGSKTTVDVGRFTMDLGSRRLVGRNNFRNATNAFAGIHADFHAADKTFVTLFFTQPLIRLPSDKASILDNKVQWDRESFDFTFWGGFLDRPQLIGRANIEGYFYGLNENDAPRLATRNRQLYTPGIRIYAAPKPGYTDFDVEAAYQFGTIRTSTAALAPEQDVSAYFVHTSIAHQFEAVWLPRISLEYDVASGDHPGGDYNRFDSLFGPRRPDFGPTGIYGPLGRSNLISPGVRVEVTPDKRWDGFAMYRAAWADSATDSFASTAVRDPAGRSGHFAGQQIEARGRYWVIPKLLRWEVGGAIFFQSRFLADAPNANGFGDTHYGYTDLTLTF